MISLQELNPKGFKLTPEQETNLKELHEKMNQVRAAYGKPMKVTSGVRDLDDHLRIYAAKGTPKDKIPMGSRHLHAQAVDIWDPKQELQKWCLANIQLLETIGLWLEAFSATPTWVHFQTRPPKSGRRLFLP